MTPSSELGPAYGPWPSKDEVPDASPPPSWWLRAARQPAAGRPSGPSIGQGEAFDPDGTAPGEPRAFHIRETDRDSAG